MLALLVDEVVGDRHRRLEQHLAGAPAHALFLQLAQDRQRQAVLGADQPGAVAMRAGLGGSLEHAGPEPLAAHLQQAEARDAADLDAGAIRLQLFLEALFHRQVVAPLFHVDEVDHDQPGQVAQAQLAGDFLGRLEIGLQRGLLDRALLGGAARVDVDGHQRLGDVDHDVAAGLELHRGVEHRAQVAFHLVAGEQRQRIGVELHVLGMGRHDHLHEVLGHPVARLALDDHLVDVLVVEVADRPLDQVALLVDLGRRDGFQGQFADLLPQALEVFVIALDLRAGALGAGGADDQPRALGHLDLAGDLLELLAVGGVGDLAGNPAAARGVGHEHAVAAGKAEVGGERRALVAAFLLDHLHQHDLAHLDHFLDLVLARAHLAGRADFLFEVFLGHRFDELRLTVAIAVAVVAGRGFRRFGHLGFGLFGRLGHGLSAFLAGLSGFGFGLGLFLAGGRGLYRCFMHQVSRRGALFHLPGQVLLGLVKLDHRHAGDLLGAGDRILRNRLFGPGLRTAARTRAARTRGARAALLVLGLLGLGQRLFLGQQRLAVGHRDLVVVGVDFRKRQEAVAVAAVIDESRLKRGLHTGDLGEIDVAG